jgi:predicted dithiol-disulfide oxidoreductase (DUF899 family)
MAKFGVVSENDAYRNARTDLLAAEIALKDQTKRVAALRRALPLGMAVHDYIFREGRAELNRHNATDFTGEWYPSHEYMGHPTPQSAVAQAPAATP